MDPDEAKQTLEAAISILSDAGVDRESALAGSALAWLLDVLSGKGAVGEASAPPAVSPPQVDAVNELDAFTKVARWSGIDRHRLEDVIEMRGDRLVLHIETSRLPKSKAGRQRALAYAYLAVRRQGFDIADVDGDEFNEFLKEYDAYDQNLAGNLDKADGSFVRRGTRRSFTYRLTIPGLEKAKNELRELIGADQ